MRPSTRLTSFVFTGACAVAFGADEAAVFRPLADAPYAASVTVSAYAAKVFLSGVGAADAGGVLAGLQRALQPLGLDRQHLVNVRGSLAPDGEGRLGASMDAWNAAWTQAFPEAERRPTRTTIGASALADGAAVYAEGVAAYSPTPDTAPPGRAALNPFVRTVGDGPFGASAAAVVLPGTAILFSAGVLADAADATKPERSVERFGPMAAQARSVFAKLETTLLSQGIQWEDIFYVRALLSPAPGQGAVDFAGFGEAFRAAFPDRHPALRPALTLWAAPGFNVNGTLLEVEVYAAAGDARGPFDRYAAAGLASPWLSMTGNPEAQISSSGTAARYRALTWFSGAIGTPGAGMHDEGVGALLALRRRLGEAGAGLGDVVQLRAYPVVGDAFRKNFDRWNEAYGRFFNHPKLNPHKPARTAFPVPALPRGAAIEVEVIAVGR
ncbi:MAG TPA: RidA family protein [Opitutaceae bacterium]